MDLVPREINAILKKIMFEKKIPNPHKRTKLEPRWFRNGLQTPMNRLLARLGLTRYISPAPLTKIEFQPPAVTLPLQQHLGATSTPIVKRGQRVNKEDCIAEIPAGARGARIHASISGTVREITDQYIRIES